MKAALAAALLVVLAACGKGGAEEAGGGERPVTTTTRPETTTTTVPVDPRTQYLEQLDRLLDGETPEFRDRAYELAVSMCDLLASTTSLGGDDAANDTPETDSSIADSATQMALDTVNAPGVEPGVNAEVMRTGADVLCPEHATVIYAYTDGML